MHATVNVAKPKFPWSSVLVAFLLGAGIEIAVATLTQARESWDTPEFVVVVLPALALITVVFALIYPRRSVVCGVAAAIGLFAAMVLRAEDFSLLPLGALLMVPILAGVALLGLFVGRLRREAARDTDVHPGDPEDEDM